MILTVMLGVLMLKDAISYYLIFTLSVIMLSVVMLNVIFLIMSPDEMTVDEMAGCQVSSP